MSGEQNLDATLRDVHRYIERAGYGLAYNVFRNVACAGWQKYKRMAFIKTVRAPEEHNTTTEPRRTFAVASWEEVKRIKELTATCREKLLTQPLNNCVSEWLTGTHTIECYYPPGATVDEIDIETRAFMVWDRMVSARTLGIKVSTTIISTYITTIEQYLDGALVPDSSAIAYVGDTIPEHFGETDDNEAAEVADDELRHRTKRTREEQPQPPSMPPPHKPS